MIDKPIAYDLFCCAGGATKGLQNAGFYVIGIDIVPRPNYCGDEFIQADALEVLRDRSFYPYYPKLINAAPPCQAANPLTTGTNQSQGWGREHVQLVPETRRLLDLTGIPYIIEQPQGSRMIRRDLRLCMDMFPIEPPRVFRHRDFEISGFKVIQPHHAKHTGRVRGYRHGVWYQGDYVAAYGNGGGKASIAEMRHALGIDWTNIREELTEAIPPAYYEYIGREFLKVGSGNAN